MLYLVLVFLFLVSKSTKVDLFHGIVIELTLRSD